MQYFCSALFILVILLPVFSQAEEKYETPWTKAIDKLKDGMPADIANFIDRMDTCEHFAGEEAYDAERAKYIEEQMKKSKCLQIKSDEQVLRSKYKSQPKIPARLDEAKKKIAS